MAREISPRTTQTKTAATTGVLLILEDFDEIRGRVASQFARRGYDVFSSATLRGALAIAREEEPQAVIIDSDMAGDCAAVAIERLREALPNSYILLVGGADSAAERNRAIMCGASKVLSKSYDQTDLNAVVEDASILLSNSKV